MNITELPNGEPHDPVYMTNLLFLTLGQVPLISLKTGRRPNTLYTYYRTQLKTAGSILNTALTKAGYSDVPSIKRVSEWLKARHHYNKGVEEEKQRQEYLYQDRLAELHDHTSAQISNGIDQLAATHNLFMKSSTESKIAVQSQIQGPGVPIPMDSDSDKAPQQLTFEAAKEEAPNANATTDLEDDSDWQTATQNLLASNDIILEITLVEDFSSFVQHLRFVHRALEYLFVQKFEKLTLPPNSEIQKITGTLVRCRAKAEKSKTISAFLAAMETQVSRFISLIIADKVNDPALQQHGQDIIARINQYLKKIYEDEFSPIKSNAQNSANVTKEEVPLAPHTNTTAAPRNLKPATVADVNGRGRTDGGGKRSLDGTEGVDSKKEGKKRRTGAKTEGKVTENERPVKKDKVSQQNTAIAPTRMSSRLRNQKQQ